MTDPITITVYGQAQSAGSKRAFAIRKKDGSAAIGKNGRPIIAVTDDNPKSKSWKNTVSQAARSVYRGDLLRGPLEVRLVFYKPRPKGHFSKFGMSKAGREAHYPTQKPDVLKLSRGVEDALTSVVWADDAQIVTELIEKRYGEPARCEITITPIKESA